MEVIANDGRIRSEKWAQEAPNWSVMVCGDWAPIDGHSDMIQQAPEKLYHDLLPMLQEADLSLVNLECILGSGGKPIQKDGPPMSAPADMVKGLTAVPFDVVCLANNHIMDYGEAGLSNTLAVLKANQLVGIGAGMTLDEARQPFARTIQGAKVSILNVAEGEEGASRGGAGVAPLDMDTLRREIGRLKQENDVVIVIAHAGRENVPFPPPYVQAAYRAMIEMGADMVIAHHPHAPQGVELYQNGLIAYSLGNFAFPYGQFYLWATVGYALRVHFTGTKVYSAEVIPYRIVDDGVALLKGNEQAGFIKRLQEFSALLPDKDKMRGLWEAYADLIYEAQIKNEMIEWSSLLMPTTELSRAARLSMSQATWLSAKIGRRFLSMVEKMLNRSENLRRLNGESAKRGATILRNRFETLAHRELYLTILGRISRGELGQSPAWAKDMLEEWYMRKGL